MWAIESSAGGSMPTARSCDSRNMETLKWSMLCVGHNEGLAFTSKTIRVPSLSNMTSSPMIWNAWPVPARKIAVRASGEICGEVAASRRASKCRSRASIAMRSARSAILRQISGETSWPTSCETRSRSHLPNRRQFKMSSHYNSFITCEKRSRSHLQSSVINSNSMSN